ncbi:MAG: hypothetical protein UX80_C0007G0013 [Candidatus Amesbacteria bacterium GW2011_GWA2_47_11b]|uniref:Uncharacterized protein n=3 Tax=Candidatus Amesiibacteriota TaxID=1752730 RepID=A0A0G1SKH0_9BACT|nr:MAG: hypothetical protein UX42_C0005G0012 [Microgenomates group bacterium GW2011_GWC1_46_20]KKU57984.1 MAG: hypothetical protein UX80_C0007G0013 [Candidatus Amesbacteria bacterium GW2011_GWA2_47_11b]KKU69989.1 MAG: hypothetical protein UX92_C0006G0036 [Candidatus Amesbacteria bacterium GW2011_GWA1_47_20]KKU84874.1 MAG: hypothetical protein UY11_C0002G0029 [Candidatus Amesbacteria bacterium GW2011_GWC2_47_8]
MAQLDYKSSLTQYRRYLAVVREQPILRQGLWLILSLGLTIVLLVAALKPTLVTIATLLGDIKQQGSIEERLDKKISAVTAAQNEYTQYQSRLQILDEALPVGKKYAVWAERIESLAAATGVKVTGLTLVEGKDFSMTLAGDYAGLRQFLGVAERLRRLVDIESAQLNKEAGLTLIIKGVLKSYEEKEN